MKFRQMLLVLSCIVAGMSCSSKNPVQSTSDQSGVAVLTVKLGAVGSLAKKTAINLDTLTIILSAPDEISRIDKVAITGSGQQIISKTYDHLASIVKTWTASAFTKDDHGIVIHSGLKDFIVPGRDTVDVSLDLRANYSMLTANIFPIRDSVTRCELMVDATKRGDSAFVKQTLLGDTIRLTYDYLSASDSGISHKISINVYGVMWGFDTLLYKADTSILIKSGENKKFAISLKWQGPSAPPPGGATMTITVGAVGSQTVNVFLDSTQTKPSQPGTAIEVAAGYYQSLILKTDRSLWACGENIFGQLGDNTTTSRSIPIKIMENVKRAIGGGVHSLILKTDGSLWGCGYNGVGQLGDGTDSNRLIPIKVMDNVKIASAGYNHSLILKNDNTLWACGYNSDGELGDGTTTHRYVPIQIMTDVQNIAAGGQHSLILRTDSTLWACGYNPNGQLGDGTTTNRAIPVKIMTNVKSMACGLYFSLILKTDSSLWVCGINSYGQLCDGTTITRLVPIQVMTGVKSMAAGWDHSLILKTDGTLWACGRNSYGSLGDGTTTPRSIPVQIMIDVQSIAAGSYHSIILKTDGELLACGFNYWGQLGNGTTTDSYFPVQVFSGQ